MSDARASPILHPLLLHRVDGRTHQRHKALKRDATTEALQRATERAASEKKRLCHEHGEETGARHIAEERATLEADKLSLEIIKNMRSPRCRSPRRCTHTTFASAVARADRGPSDPLLAQRGGGRRVSALTPNSPLIDIKRVSRSAELSVMLDTAVAPPTSSPSRGTTTRTSSLRYAARWACPYCSTGRGRPVEDLLPPRARARRHRPRRAGRLRATASATARELSKQKAATILQDQLSASHAASGHSASFSPASSPPRSRCHVIAVTFRASTSDRSSSFPTPVRHTHRLESRLGLSHHTRQAHTDRVPDARLPG